MLNLIVNQKIDNKNTIIENKNKPMLFKPFFNNTGIVIFSADENEVTFAYKNENIISPLRTCRVLYSDSGIPYFIANHRKHYLNTFERI